MDPGRLLAQARCAAGLTQQELADRAGTSRTTVSAYERGTKSPTLDTMARLLAAAGRRLTYVPRVEFTHRTTDRGRPFVVPSHLPRLATWDAVATVRLPIHLNWSAPERVFRLADRCDRSQVYEIVLREGTPEDLLTYVDGALLVDLWEELVLPREIRAAWAPVIAAAVEDAA